MVAPGARTGAFSTEAAEAEPARAAEPATAVRATRETVRRTVLERDIVAPVERRWSDVVDETTTLAACHTCPLPAARAAISPRPVRLRAGARQRVGRRRRHELAPGGHGLERAH